MHRNGVTKGVKNGYASRQPATVWFFPENHSRLPNSYKERLKQGRSREREAIIAPVDIILQRSRDRRIAAELRQQQERSNNGSCVLSLLLGYAFQR